MRGFIITVLLGLTMDVTSGMISIQLIPQYPVINGSVTLSLTGIAENFEYVSWHKGRNTDRQSQILSYFPGSASPLVTGQLHNPRFSVFNNGSLQIKDLRTTDRGDYTVKIQAGTQKDITGTLTVYEPVTKPEITASNTQPKENGPYTLTCDTSHAMIIRWTRRGSSISPNTKLSGDNKTLTFSSVRRENSGEYQCEAQNFISNDSSDPYKVTVAYGPDEAQLETPLFVRPGSPITLSCSADSFPSAEYQWKVNGKVLEEKANNYHISNAENEDQGLYTCVVRNPVTNQTSTASVYVIVFAESIISILGFAFSIISGVVLIIIGSVWLYKKSVTKRMNGSTENRRENICFYENTKAAQRKEESPYTDLQFRTEDIYTERTT